METNAYHGYRLIRTRKLTWLLMPALSACASRPAAPSSTAAVSDSVVVGYGAQASTKVTGAVARVPDGAMTNRPLQIETILRGRVPGLQVVPGPSGPSFRIRGAGTLLQDVEPLFVIDGVQLDGSQAGTVLAGLMPEQVRSITVLKDVASTSVYGMRGAGGVIIIITRR